METKSNEYHAVEIKNVKHLAYWTGSWVLTVALAAVGPKLLWDYNSSISILAIIASTIVGVGMILMNRKYTNGLDEMHRKIAMDAMAIALGAGVVGGLSYALLDLSNVISFNAEIGHLVMLMGITYLVSFVVGTIRYK